MDAPMTMRVGARRVGARRGTTTRDAARGARAGVGVAGHDAQRHRRVRWMLKKCNHARASSSSSSTSRVGATDADGDEQNVLSYALRRVKCVSADSKTRVALPGAREDVVGERPFSDAVFGCIFSALAFAALGAVDECVRCSCGAPFMCGSWASLSVLAFGVMDAPPMRLWNVVVGTTCSAAIAATLVGAFGAGWGTRALSVSLSTACMMRVGAIHPPAGALAMIIVDNAAFTRLGYAAVAYPALLGSLFIVGASAACQTMKRRVEFEWSDVVAAVGGARRA